MNRKGFTLIELIAVIVVLGIILVIAAPSISNAYKNSRLKSEEIFVNRLSGVIDSYVKLNTDEIGFTSVGTANKDEQGSTYTVNLYKGIITESDIEREIIVNDIIKVKLLSFEDYVNAGNKDVDCNPNAEIEVYRDSDFVYCHKVKKESLGCLTEDYQKSITGDYVIDTCIWSE